MKVHYYCEVHYCGTVVTCFGTKYFELAWNNFCRVCDVYYYYQVSSSRVYHSIIFITIDRVSLLTVIIIVNVDSVRV